MDVMKAALELVSLPAFVAFTVWLGRRKHCPNFSYWVKTEGAPIFGGILIVMAILTILLR
jgi:hypothetical protein